MYEAYYPIGGAEDFIGSVETKEEIRIKIEEHLKKDNFDTYLNIIDTKLGKIYKCDSETEKDFCIINNEFNIDECKFNKIIDEEKFNKILKAIEE
jgi:hypothetical protein